MQFGFLRRNATENMSHLSVQNNKCGLIKHDIPELSALVLVFRPTEEHLCNKKEQDLQQFF